jgi:8-amino-3,8-dideoxy-alpha-D-manno-octulosonate transaminase
MPGFEVIGSEEFEQVADVFRNGGVLFRQGFDSLRNGVFKVAELERVFAESMGAVDALAVTSGTAALRVALAALNFEPGDEVVIPAFTFVATAEAVIESGGVPVCVEIDDTLNMDPMALASAIGPRTAAVIAVHMLGTPARLHEIVEICGAAGIPLLEDAAWGCGGSLGGRRLGTWGRMGTFSFDFAKTMTTGEGGMIVFADGRDAKAARAWHDHGHDSNPAVPRWEDTRSSSGFNYRMMELQGAVGLAQLAKLDDIVRGQRSSHEATWQALSGLEGLTLRSEPAGSHATCDALVFETPDAQTARKCRDSLLAAGGGTKILPEAVTWHFAAHWDHMPILAAQHHGGLRHAFPASEARLARCVALPMSAVGSGLSPDAIRVAVKSAMRIS